MTIIEKHRTEYELINQAMDELSKATSTIDTLKASAEKKQTYIEELQARTDTLQRDLEKMTDQRNRLEAEIKDIQESMRKQMILRDAEREKLKKDLEWEASQRKDVLAIMQKSFTQIQDLMNAAIVENGSVGLMQGNAFQS
jgi:predicted RNase H-like nuclease (RuvC/YqgF family)